jgi:hypothetical protein
LNCLGCVFFNEEDFIEAVAEHGGVSTEAELRLTEAVVDVLSYDEFVFAGTFNAALVVDNGWDANFLHVFT